MIFKVPGLGMLILGSERSRGFDDFSHVISGCGFPVVLHSNEPSSPLVTKTRASDISRGRGAANFK